MDAEGRAKFYANFAPPTPPDPVDAERARLERIAMIERAGGEVA